MNGHEWARTARWLGWWIERNPMYLLSAACMAVGARLYLVSPSTRAGDVGLILLTLGVLQFYEWAVTAILMALHRWGRSPEDEPSLLLVAGLFWTGPLAATAEMTAHRAHLGLACAAGACAIALAELSTVRRLMGYRFSVWGRLAACACVVLLAVSPPLLRVPESVSGTNEIALYCAWWLLAGLALAGAGIVRFHARRGELAAMRPLMWFDFGIEMAFVGLVLAATAGHLVGMNYAYFGHAEWFYGSPLMVAVSVVAMEYLALAQRRRGVPLAAAAVLPAVAIVLARVPFSEQMPVTKLPVWFRDPLLTMLVIAAAAWWFGYVRHRAALLLHAGSAALGLAALRAMQDRAPQVATAVVPALETADVPARDLIVMALYGLTVYLALVSVARRSRIEGLAAIAVHQAAVTFLVLDRTPADVMIVCLVAGWHCVAAMHVLGRPRPAAIGAVIALLVALTWAYDFSPLLCWHARSHAVLMLIPLIIAGEVRWWMPYRYIWPAVAAAHGVFYFGRWIAEREHSTASLVVLAAFGLLAIGAMVSWHKRVLLGLARTVEMAEPSVTPE